MNGLTTVKNERVTYRIAIAPNNGEHIKEQINNGEEWTDNI